MTSSHTDTVPLWVLNTLLMNIVFGFPGGDAKHMDLTTGGFDILIQLAIKPEIPKELPIHSGPANLQEEWETYIMLEQIER